MKNKEYIDLKWHMVKRKIKAAVEFWGKINSDYMKANSVKGNGLPAPRPRRWVDTDGREEV